MQDDDLDRGLERDTRYGFWRVKSAKTPAQIEAFYRHAFYTSEKPEYLEKTKHELLYWDLLWGVRLELMGRAVDGPGVVLDVGAGGGFFLDRAQRDGWAVAGVEPSIHACDFAKVQYGLDLIRGRFEDLPSDATYDAIHMAFVLEHVPDPENVLAYAFDILRPGGALWVEVPNDFSRLQRVVTHRLNKPDWWVVTDHHLNYFDFESLGCLLHGVGFTEVERMGSFPMELFVLMGLDYIGDDSVGSKTHDMRMALEQHLLSGDKELFLSLYRSLAVAGIGRSCNFLVQKPYE